MRTLVAYFSVTGVTARLANRIALAAKADIFRIKPKNPYTEADLNWQDKTSRTTLEMKNSVFRPKIEEALESMKPYGTILLGFPIWWYVAPSIIKTFLESYDFSDKKIILFATSGGTSKFGETVKILQPCCPTATFFEGKIFNNPSDEEIKTWLKSLPK